MGVPGIIYPVFTRVFSFRSQGLDQCDYCICELPSVEHPTPPVRMRFTSVYSERDVFLSLKGYAVTLLKVRAMFVSPEAEPDLFHRSSVWVDCTDNERDPPGQTRFKSESSTCTSARKCCDNARR
jgi:hypothetical protein